MAENENLLINSFSCLHFDGVDRFSNFNNSGFQKSRGRLVRDSESFVQAYLNSRGYIHIELRFDGALREIEAAACGAPFVNCAEVLQMDGAAIAMQNSETICFNGRQRDNLVSAVIPEVVQSPQNGVACFMGIYFSHNVDYILMHVFASASLDICLNAISSVSDQKLSSGWLAIKNGNRTGINSMVQSIPQIARNGTNLSAYASGYIDRKLNVYELLSSFSVELNTSFVTLMAEKGFYKHFDTGDAFFRFVD